jgi:glycosyltransferase involved in cell wall biosynthesis
MAPNLETGFLQSLARGKRGLPRWLYEKEARRMAGLEPELLSRAHAIGVVNEREGDWIRERVPGVPVVYLPVGMPGPDAAQPPVDREGFLAIGSLGWPPNRDAVHWLLRELWPRIRERAPGARLTLVGQGTDAIDLGNVAGVRGTGLVPDVKLYLRGTRALLVPLRSGAGIRVKILEALSCAAPVVTTEEGLGDLPARSGEHLLVARNAADLIDAALKLESDPEAATALGRRGQAWVLREFSMQALEQRLERLLAEAIRGSAGSVSSS